VPAVLLETVADAAIAGAVAVVGAVTLAPGEFYWLDPTVAPLVSTLIAYHAVMLLRRVTGPLRSELPAA
jgi:cobalt-zinc-cadmium efflux system protein